jgi:hypothetical protein
VKFVDPLPARTAAIFVLALEAEKIELRILRQLCDSLEGCTQSISCESDSLRERLDVASRLVVLRSREKVK